jgi:hypothetical protein
LVGRRTIPCAPNHLTLTGPSCPRTRNQRPVPPPPGWTMIEPWGVAVEALSQ